MLIRLKRIFIFVFLIPAGYNSYCQNTVTGGMDLADKFRAGVVKVDITPDNSQYLIGYQERKSTGIYDRIYHRIVVLDDGTSQFVLASTEICILSPVEYELVAEQLRDQFGIDPVNFWWSTTHTHSAPEVGTPGIYKIYMGERNKHEIDLVYTASVKQKLIEGVREARQKLIPARLGVGWGYSQANINRRAIDSDGKASLGLNPDGPVDRRIGLLKIEGEDGKPVALIANYPIHGTVMGGTNLEISGDAPGVVSDYVEKKIGAPVLFINGAAGNLAPIYSVYPSPRAGHLSEFRVLLGDKVLEAYNKINSTTGDVKLNAGSKIVETPRKAGMGWPSDCGSYSRRTTAGIDLVRLPVRFLKINDDIAIWSAPLELFCEISNEIRDRSSYPFTFYYGYTNGWFGYLVAAPEYKHEGYEPRVSPFTPAADRHLTEAVISYINGNRTEVK
jgi:hypothetical protein